MNDLSVYVDTKEFSLVLEDVHFKFFDFSSGNDSCGFKSAYQLLHIHSYYELFVSADEYMDFDTQDGSVRIRCGELLIVPPDYRHTVFSVPSESQRFCSYGIVGERIGDSPSGFRLWQRCRHIFKSQGPMIYEIGRAQAEEFIRKINGIRASEPTLSAIVSLALLVDRIADCRCRAAFENSTAPLVERMSPTVRDVDINRIIILEQLINSSYSVELRADYVATVLHVSRRQLDRIVKKRYGTTLCELVRQKRLELAKNLLATTADSIERISQDAGYQSRDSFSRNFCEHFGITPSDYRKSCKKH